MVNSRAPWWMFVIAAVFVLTFFFNARQEAWGPANAGWVPSWPSCRVVGVAPAGAMEKAGVRAGDTLESVNGRPITGMPDWFVARAHFERGRPIALEIQRGNQHVSLQMIITAAAWRSWNRGHLTGEAIFYSARFILLLLAIVVGFSRPERYRARLVALMFAVGAVAEGYPSSGWAAALQHLPAVLAIPVCLATASCLLSSLLWLPFFATFHRGRVLKGRGWVPVYLPGALFGTAITASTVALIFAPAVLARPWPQVLSAAPVRLVQDIAGVSPLLFLNVLPAYQPISQIALVTLWFVLTALYFVAGFSTLAVCYFTLDDPRERRRVGVLCLVVIVFALTVAHNILTRNWNGWFGGPRPALLSSTASVGADIVFLVVPLVLAHYVLTEKNTVEGSTRRAEAT